MIVAPLADQKRFEKGAISFHGFFFSFKFQAGYFNRQTMLTDPFNKKFSKFDFFFWKIGNFWSSRRCGRAHIAVGISNL